MPGLDQIQPPAAATGPARREDRERDATYVLVVDDEALVRLVVTDLLESLGFRTEEAATAGEAIDLLRDAQVAPVAAVIDLGLPDRRGDALVTEIRDIDRYLAIVIASGYDEDGLDEQLRDDPRVAFLGKPFDTRQLHARLLALGVCAPNGEP